MAANRKDDKTTTRSPSSIARHDSDRVIVLSTFLLTAMMAIVW
jgi:hypothetical protein